MMQNYFVNNFGQLNFFSTKNVSNLTFFCKCTLPSRNFSDYLKALQSLMLLLLATYYDRSCRCSPAFQLQLSSYLPLQIKQGIFGLKVYTAFYCSHVVLKRLIKCGCIWVATPLLGNASSAWCGGSRVIKIWDSAFKRQFAGSLLHLEKHVSQS